MNIDKRLYIAAGACLIILSFSYVIIKFNDYNSDNYTKHINDGTSNKSDVVSKDNKNEIEINIIFGNDRYCQYITSDIKDVLCIEYD